MQLYEIDKQFRELYDEIISQDGEVTEEQIAQMEALNIAKDDKIEGYGVLIRELQSDIEECDQEIKRIKEIQARKKNLSERLSSTLQSFMENYQIPKYQSVKVNISFRKSQVLEINDDAEIPDEYMRVKEVREPNKADIKDAIKHGVEFKGIYLIDKQNIQIK